MRNRLSSTRRRDARRHDHGVRQGALFEGQGAASGNTQLGGTDMDKPRFEHFADPFAPPATGRRRAPTAWPRRGFGKRAKSPRSNRPPARRRASLCPSSLGRRGPSISTMQAPTRAELERIVRPVVERCREPVLQAFHDANIETTLIDRLVFVGGPTRTAIVRAFFEDLLGRKGETGVHPMDAFAQEPPFRPCVLAGEVGSISCSSTSSRSRSASNAGRRCDAAHRPQHACSGQAFPRFSPPPPT